MGGREQGEGGGRNKGRKGGRKGMKKVKSNDLRSQT